MQKRDISFSAIFLSVIIVLALLIMLGLIGIAIDLQIQAPKDEPISDNIFVLMGFGGVILLSLSFFLAAYLASFFADAREFTQCLGHGLGTWALLTFLLGFASIAAVGVLDLRQSFSAINNPYINTDIEILNARAITRLVLGGHKQGNKEIIIQLAKTKHLVSWVACISMCLGLVVTFGAAVLSRRPRAA